MCIRDSTGVEKREELKEREIDWQVAMKRGQLKAVPEDRVLGQLLRKLESVKASIRSKVCLLYTSPSPRDRTRSRMPSSA